MLVYSRRWGLEVMGKSQSKAANFDNVTWQGHSQNKTVTFKNDVYLVSLIYVI